MTRLASAYHQHLHEDGAPPAHEANLYPWMPYWYAALYVVAEGWQELGLQDAEIDGLLGDPALGLLKRYRNGVFHFQREYHDDRLTEFIAEGAASAQWAGELHDAFSRWFLDFFRDLKDPVTHEPPSGRDV